MDKSDTLRNVLVAASIFFAVMWIAPKIIPAPPTATSSTQTASESSTGQLGREGGQVAPATNTGTNIGTNTGEYSAGTVGQVSNAPAGADVLQRFTVVEAPEVRSISMGTHEDDRAVVADKKTDRDKPFRMGLVLSNVGASIEVATMTDHRELLHRPAHYKLLAPSVSEQGVTTRSLAVEAINIDGVDVSLHDKLWQADNVTTYERSQADGSKQVGQSLTFHLDIIDAGEPAIRLTRVFRLPAQPVKKRRHDLYDEITIENLNPQRQRRVIVSYRGGLGIRAADTRMDDRFVDCGIYQGEGLVVGSRLAAAKAHGNAGGATSLFSRSGENKNARLCWAATANTYFTCTIAPQSITGENQPAYITEVSAYDVDGLIETADDVTVKFVTQPADLGAKPLTYRSDIYVGEKEFNGFRRVDSYKSRNYYYQISQGYGMCTFSWLVELMIWLLNSLHFVVRDFGVAIIILVLIVRTLLHPITKKGQVNMVKMQKRMQEMAPKIEEIKRKYANDKTRMNQEMMKLNINPAGQILTCLPMFIQMPIWVALWISLSNNISMRHEGFLFTWIHDLTAPDELYRFAQSFTIPILGSEITAFNLLPVLLAAAMYAQQKMQPKPAPNPNMSDQQKQQQEMMQKMGPMMSIMMFVIFYKAPSGLTLYIMTSSVFGTIEQFRIRKHIREHEEAGTLFSPKEKAGKDGKDKKPGKPSFFERMQKAATDAQQAQQQRSGKPKGRKP